MNINSKNHKLANKIDNNIVFFIGWISRIRSGFNKAYQVKIVLNPKIYSQI